MASISTSEKDFETVASAAVRAFRAGDQQGTEDLDRIARKINAALPSDARSRSQVRSMGGRPKRLAWRDVSSVLEDL